MAIMMSVIHGECWSRVEEIYEKNGFISTDVFSTHRGGRQIGESAMIVIDSVTGEYEKVGIPFGNGLREE